MAPAHLGRAGWVDVRPLRQPAHARGTSHRPPFDPRNQQALSSLPIIGHRSPASSSFVLARALTGR